MRYSGISIFGFVGEDPSKELYGFNQYNVTESSYRNFPRMAAKKYDTIVTKDNYQYAIREGEDIGNNYEDHFTENLTGKPMYMCQILFTENHPCFNIVKLNEVDNFTFNAVEVATKFREAVFKVMGAFMKGKLP
jgi:hypothetical protein